MAKWLRVGKVMAKKAPKTGSHVAIGDYDQKRDDALTVTVTVKNKKGEVLASVDNPFFQIQDPRKRPGITEEQAAKIPAFIKQELVLVVDE